MVAGPVVLGENDRMSLRIAADLGGVVVLARTSIGPERRPRRVQRRCLEPLVAERAGSKVERSAIDLHQTNAAVRRETEIGIARLVADEISGPDQVATVGPLFDEQREPESRETD